jgi:hypothetical protein
VQTDPDEKNKRSIMYQPIRTLKIEESGDFWKRRIKPKIRLTGRWLERAGFTPGNHVRVTCLATGVIELRTPDVMMTNETKQPTSECSLQNAS